MAWSLFTGSPEVKVAILDGAFQPEHSDFDQSRFYRTALGLPGQEYHGTKVASVLGAKSDNVLLMTGVDWGCSMGLYSVNPASRSNIVDALAAAVAHGARVINCCWIEQEDDPDFPDVVQRKVADAYQAGVVIVAAAGHKDQDWYSPFPVAPASFDGLAICVTGLDQYGRLHPLSNYGWGTDFVSIADTIGVALTKSGSRDTAITDFNGTSLAGCQ